MQQCPCNPDHLYTQCCYPLHIGEKKAQDPLELMKSRYSAYAMKLPIYIIETTHPKNPAYEEDHLNWELSLDKTCSETLFLKLEILEHTHNENEGYVTFKAYMEKLGQDISFQERSRFIFENSNWYYLDGRVKPFKR